MWAALAAVVLAAGAARSQTPAQAPAPTAAAEVVVSATKVDEDPLQIATPVAVVTGEQLRRTGARTVAEAIQDVVGVDTGNGSDNGARMANIGMWGLKEFDALLVTVDGVPVGGPFNPSLSQIPIEDVERVEIVKGPQGTLYGVSAFAGMIQVFTRRPARSGGGSASIAGGSFGDKRISASWSGEVAPDLTLRASGAMERGDGWQDRTDQSVDRLALSGEKRWGDARLGVNLTVYRDTGYFGSPLPVDAGQPIPGFVSDRNYAIGGARLDHRLTSLSSSFSLPLGSGLKLDNTLGLARDEQMSVRSFIGDVSGSTATAAGVSLRPVESSVFDDLRLVGEFAGAGLHRLVAGAAVTWGRTTATGTGFDFDLVVTPAPIVPDVGDVPVGDHRSFEDRRTFLGFYLNDEWTPTPRLTVTAGARYDATSESLAVTMQEVGTPAPDEARDSRSDGQLSGGVSALFRLVTGPSRLLDTANIYVAAKSAFKPAAPNLSEAESARILEPERTRSGEVGLKTRWLDRSLRLDVSLFHMTFENMVVSLLGQDGRPALTNAGEQRFQGAEIDAAYRPPALPGLELAAGYAHHDATFVHFSFLTPDGQLRVVDGKRLELVPRDLWNLRLAYGPTTGPGGFVAVRHQNSRPLTRRNTFYTDGFFETDAGLTWDFSWGRVGVVGRNLGDSRHYIADSELGDSQFYVAPPRRFSAEFTVRF
jgi:outer membrane receptor protein involved in Fe transport